jgi:hypothetical protein
MALREAAHRITLQRIDETVVRTKHFGAGFVGIHDGRAEESINGLLARIFKKSMHSMLVKALQEGLSALKHEAERPAYAKAS